ncbi:MAG: hypothetical protein J5588_09965, partial [Bacteroidales bacterium]|nr:hypothetical protein [Bacteroidales bacterium]
MKKIAFIATTFILCGIQLFAQDSTYYWKNGKIQCKGAWLDGTEQGLWTYWDSLGNKVQESTFLRGRLNGKNCIYKNGIKIQEATYVLNELSGPYTEWNEEGTKMVEGYYKRNKQDSSWKYYYPQGVLKKELLYKNDTMLVWNQCYIRGGCTVANGNGSYQETWGNGSVKTQGNIKDGYREGEWISYFENNKVKSKGCYRQGEKVGNWIEYYGNGNVKEKISMTDCTYWIAPDSIPVGSDYTEVIVDAIEGSSGVVLL